MALNGSSLSLNQYNMYYINIGKHKMRLLRHATFEMGIAKMVAGDMAIS